MRITYLTQQTWEKVYEPANCEPSLTRESDYESIESLFARFKASGLMAEVYKPIAQLSSEERDILDNGVDIDDLLDEDITVQKDFIDKVQGSLKTEKKEQKSVVTEPTQPSQTDEPEKAAKEPENA